MSCKGCYKEGTDDYCRPCRARLFDGVKLPAILSFDAPKADNLKNYQEHTKRLSISGVQLKYSLHLENGELKLTEKGGQYILKPIPPAQQLVAVEAVPENEHLSMQMAAQIFGIHTAGNALIYFRDGSPAYITRRFDVKPDGTKYLQEDFAQLSKRSKASHGDAFKYDGSYEEIGHLIRRFVPAAIPALERFFQLLVFNYSISNGDAHMKNFSLLRSDEGEYLLSPAYDLMATVIHTPNASDVALDLYQGDIQSPFYSTYGYYGSMEFLELAGRIGIHALRAERILQSFPANRGAMEAMIHNSFLSTEIKNTYLANLRDKISRLRQKL